MSVRYRSRSRTNLFLVLVLSLFCILLIGFGVFLFFRGGIDRNEIQRIYQVEGLDPAAKIGRLPGSENVGQPASETDFVYQLNTAPSFTRNGKDGELLIGNPAVNQYLMVVEIRLEGSESVCYQSQFIAPNQYIEKASLKLIPGSPGAYPATAYINAVDPQTLDLVGTLETPVTVTIQE
ncbi:hypothetical protein C814_01379 [Anaerotruncus sp. G3(2012)]|uniref:hypothetical protein n=1 Tax=Anaerotruncus sp. G3(2012) TaxID=1235835 RepID=UPI000339800E|nr:hypothetical protein [Anaerotruncus sp. G3(2012)]EOS61459.1 hypothetical protein C814_01379 [Anaerotruncus sp. G3(2012)]